MDRDPLTLSEASQRVLGQLDAEPGQSSIPVGPSLLLTLALTECHARALLDRHQITHDWLRAEFETSFRALQTPRSANSPEDRRLQITTIVRTASRIARREHAGEIGTEHLLFAVVQSEPEIAELLRKKDFSPSRPESRETDAPPVELTELPDFSSPIHSELQQPAPHPTVEPARDVPLVGPRETSRVGRILDAAANRAREGLRVLEDYVRFVLNDSFLTSELKTIRHELAQQAQASRLDQFLPFRDTLHDVGTSLTNPCEESRETSEQVLTVNFKRLQEALRTLEEFSKITDPAAARTFEKLRYRTYTLEKTVAGNLSSRKRLTEVGVCLLLTEKLCTSGLEATLRGALEGGVRLVQLREKDRSDHDLLKLARIVRTLTRDFSAQLIINDRTDLALLSGADGVHLGQEDAPLEEVRRLTGHDFLIGVSTHSLDQARQAALGGADYIGVGPVFPSRTKHFDAHVGIELVLQVARDIALPAFAIGGIHAGNAGELLEAGADRIAVSQAICAAADPRHAAQELCRMFTASRHVTPG